MASALIGHTGFVGGTLLRQRPFDDCYNSSNIESIAGKSYDFLVVSGMPAAMWIANRDPVADRAVLDRLFGCIQQCQAKQVVVMSTVAVYPEPWGVNENSPIESNKQTAYGRHRHELETLISQRFDSVLCIRLPGLFGPGLKKNAIYDLIHNNEVDKIHPASVYQFYNLNNLWRDIQSALRAGLDVVNFGTEPVSMSDVASQAFDRILDQAPSTPPARYDMQTIHASKFGASGLYTASRSQVLSELRDFVQKEIAALGVK